MDDIGKVIGRVLSFLPDEFKSLLKKRVSGEITQTELEQKVYLFLYSRIDNLKPRALPEKPEQLIDYEKLSFKEKKEFPEDKLKAIKFEYFKKINAVRNENFTRFYDLNKMAKIFKQKDYKLHLEIIKKMAQFYPKEEYYDLYNTIKDINKYSVIENVRE